MPEHQGPSPQPIQKADGPARAPQSGAETPLFGPVRSPHQVARIGRMIGNRGLAGTLADGPSAGAVLRMPITAPNQSETLYENPNLSPGGVPIAKPTAGQKQFVATSYGGTVKYDMARSATDVTVTVNILFVDQKRGENQFLKDKTGNFVLDANGKKQADPEYTRNVGKMSEIKDAERKDFATSHCAGVTKSWDHYDFVGKEIKSHGFFNMTAAKKEEIRLPVKFVAKPVFDLSARNVHTTIRLFGMGTEANRSGAHPVDAGHWYMDTKKNYGSMNLDAVTAHEYGHLIGLPDEYSQSNDFMHQMLHRMGGGQWNADKVKDADRQLDQFAVRQMAARAMLGPITTAIEASREKVAAELEQSKDVIGRHLSDAVNLAWRDASIRSMMSTEIHSGLEAGSPKGKLGGHRRTFDASTVKQAVLFETGKNLSNITVAKGQMANFTKGAISQSMWDSYATWWGTMNNQVFKMKGADGSEASITAATSANVNDAATTGPVKTEGAAYATSAVGAAGVVGPSPSLFNAIEQLPKKWKSPREILHTHDAAFLKSHVRASLDTAAGAWPKVKNVPELYQKLLALVTSTAEASAKAAIETFLKTSVGGTIREQLDIIKGQIEAEIDAAMGTKVDGKDVKSADPNLKKVAEHLHGLLTAQQNSKLWDQKGDVNPGKGSAGMDVRYSSNSVMSANDTSVKGQRSDMIAPVLEQFNSNLKKSYEDKFRAEVKR